MNGQRRFEDVKTYSELKIRLDIMGAPDYPPESLFDIASRYDKMSESDVNPATRLLAIRNWLSFCASIEERLSRNMPLSKMTMWNSGMLP